VVRLAGLTRQEIASVEMRERDWLNRRLGRLRGDRPPVPLAGRTAVVVDDGDRDRLDGPRGLAWWPGREAPAG
jgi:predicted phosphoribosyltransferase